MIASSPLRCPLIPPFHADTQALFEHNAALLLSILQEAGGGLWLWRANSEDLLLSGGARELLGLPPTTSLPCDQLLHADDCPALLQSFSQMWQGLPRQSARFRLARPSGSDDPWFELSGCRLQDADGNHYLTGLLQRAARPQSTPFDRHSPHQQLHEWLQLMPEGMALLRYRDGCILQANAALAEILGWSVEQMLGRSSRELQLWVDLQQRANLLQLSRARRQLLSREVRLRRRDGQLVDTLMSVQHITLQGEDCLLVTLLDNREAKRTEAALRASEEKFAQAFRMTPDAVVISDKETGRFIEINASFERRFGWSPSEALGRTSIELQLWVDPADRARLIDSIASGRSEEIETHFRARDGSISLNLAYAAEFILNDRPALILTLRDITQQRAAEAALQASQEKFAKAFHSSPDAISISDLISTEFLEVNEGFSRLTGYQAEEVVGRSFLDINIWANENERPRLQALLNRHGRVSNLPILGRHKDGSPLYLSVSIEPFELNGRPCMLSTSRDISELKAAEARIQHLAYHDALTNLPNRSLLTDRLTQQIALLKRHRMRGALLFLDLDRFKHINDSLGHATGDAVLRLIAARLESSVRQEDTVARLGGDEFVVLLSGLEGDRPSVTQAVRAQAEKIRALLAQPMLIEGTELQVTPSIGIALLPDHGETPNDLLKHADIALYRAKDAGRNAIKLFHSSMLREARERLRLENDLRLALGREEFILHFQPQVDARDGRIVGAEVLLRWHHPTLGGQSPAEFIPVLEESGLIIDVGGWVLTEACRACALLIRQGLIDPTAFSLSVNISPRQFGQAEFAEIVAQALQQSGLPATMLKLEVTESIVIRNLEDTIGKMHQLKQNGIGFAMDDFGTGYSSLTYLKRLPVDVLKIDQSFVRDATHDPNDAEIIRAIVAMANSLKLQVIAEGVEHPEQLEFLEQHDCHLYQGYLFSRPLPLGEFRALLATAGHSADSH